MTDADPDLIRSMADLRTLKIRLGQNPDEVGYADDYQQRRGTGELLLSRAADGGWLVAAYERDHVLDPQHFDTELMAIRWFAERAVHRSAQPVRWRPKQDRATLDARRAHMIARSRQARDTR